MWRLLSVFAALALAGCNAEPLTHPVSGAVTFSDGSAVSVGLIEFLPTAGGPSPRGVIQPGGTYSLTTYEADDGAPTGDYAVLVSQPQLAVGAMRPAPEGHDDEHHNGESPGASIVPTQYGRRASSPLRATVSVGDNRCDFVIKTMDESGPAKTNEDR